MVKRTYKYNRVSRKVVRVRRPPDAIIKRRWIDMTKYPLPIHTWENRREISSANKIKRAFGLYRAMKGLKWTARTATRGPAVKAQAKWRRNYFARFGKSV